MKLRVSRSALGLGLLLFAAAAFRLFVLNRPFEYDAEGASACEYGILARSYLRFAWTATHGMPVLTSAHIPSAPIVFYPDHPPLVPLLILPFYALFGVGEWQTRLPIAALTVAAIYVVYRLLARSVTPRAGLTAAALFAAAPMTLYFGGMPDVMGIPLVFFMLLVVAAYVRWYREPLLTNFWLLLAAFLLAGSCDWPAYVIVPVLLVHFVATRPRAEWPRMLTFAFAACVLFAAVYVYIALATHSSWNWIVPLFVRHSAIGGGQGFTLTEWLGNAGVLNRTYHTLPLLLACAVWLGAFGFRFRRADPGATLARLLLAWGVLCILIGNKAAYNHHFVWGLLTPGIAVSAALLIEESFHWSERCGFETAMSAGVTLAILLFASWTGYLTVRLLYGAARIAPFTPAEMAQAIQIAAPRSMDLALIIGGDGGSGGQLWFYGDRPLRTNVWSIPDVERRLRGDTADVLFDFAVQPWSASATGIVFPRWWDREFPDVRLYLEEHYPVVRLPPALSSKFEVFAVAPD